MNIIAKKSIRFALGSIASLATFFALDLLPWKIDTTDYGANSLYLLLAATVAVSVFISAFVGAIVARVNFIGPAFLLGILAWALAVSFLKAVSAAYSPEDLVLFLVANAGGLSVAIGGAVGGALLGRRIAKPIEDKASIAA